MGKWRESIKAEKRPQKGLWGENVQMKRKSERMKGGSSVSSTLKT